MLNNCELLISSVSQTTERGNSMLDTIFHSDQMNQSSPIRLSESAPAPALLNAVVDSSPLSSPPGLDLHIEHRLLLEFGNRELIKLQPYSQRLQAAIDTVRAGNMTKKDSLRSVAADFNVNKDTLRRRLAGGRSKQEAGLDQEKLQPSEGLVVIEFVDYLFKLGIPCTVSRLLDLFNELLMRRYAAERFTDVRSLDGQSLPVDYRANEETVRRFIKRHKEIGIKLSANLDSKRAQQTNRDIALDFQKKLRRILCDYCIDPADIWNFDETGYAAGGLNPGSTRVIVPANTKHSNRTSSDSREWISVIESVSAAGVALPPYFIFKGKTLLRRISDKLDQSFDNWAYGISANGWTDDFHAVQWLAWWERLSRPTGRTSAARLQLLSTGRWVARRNNDQLVVPTSIQPRFRLLILDGHGSHLTGAFIQYTIDHNVILLVLPPHTSHYLQPLDVGVFTHMKSRYRSRVQARADTGRASMCKDKFIELYASLRPLHFNADKIKEGFRDTGILPIDIKPLERHFRDAPIDELQRLLQIRQPTVQNQVVQDRGLQLPQATGIATNEVADTRLIGDLIFLATTNNAEPRVNPQASYHAVCDQITIEDNPVRREALVEALRTWCGRKELQSKTFKYAGNLLYNATVDNKKTAVEVRDRSHAGLGRIIDKDAWQAELDRREAQRLDEEMANAAKAADKARRQAQMAAKKQQIEINKLERLKRKRSQSSTPCRQLSQLSQDITPLLDPQLIDLPLPQGQLSQRSRSGSLASIASQALEELMLAEESQESQENLL